ncbi:MAG: tetratricopeptide repeat protein [Bdellovibrionota bacterium]
MKFFLNLFILLFISKVSMAQTDLIPSPIPDIKSKTPSKSKESYKDIIQKAQSLTLQQDRLQASQVLVRVIKSETYNRKAQEELKKTLNNISTLFYTEKTQKFYEYAKSLLRESPAEAAEKFKEAIKVEPDNILILLWMARLAMVTGKCEEANTSITKALEINPFYPQLQLTDLQIKACLQVIEPLNKSASEYKYLETLYPLYFNMVLVQKFFTQKQYPEATYHIEKAKQIDKEFPEIYFWESQILEKQELSFKDAASRYIRGCKTITKADYLKYELEPRLCHEFKTFEVEYKGILDQEKKDN